MIQRLETYDVDIHEDEIIRKEIKRKKIQAMESEMEKIK